VRTLGRDREALAAGGRVRASLLALAQPLVLGDAPRGLHGWIRQRIESIFWTLKDRLGPERHRAFAPLAT
jgi:hypothetical protein